MANIDLKRHSQPMRNQERGELPDWWYYEDARGIHVHHQYPATEDARSAFISWRQIRAALQRRDR